MTDTVSEVLEEVHPEFVPELGLWIEPVSHIAAESLRELRRFLPDGTRIKDYYPKGYGLIVQPREVYKMPIEELSRTPTTIELRAAVRLPAKKKVFEGPKLRGPMKEALAAHASMTPGWSQSENSVGSCPDSLPAHGESEPLVTTASLPTEPEPKPVEIQQEVPFVQPKQRMPKSLKPGWVDWDTYDPLLKKLAASGLSMGKIAKQIPNATRSSVAGRGRRKGIKFEGTCGPPKGYTKEKDVVEET